MTPCSLSKQGIKSFDDPRCTWEELYKAEVEADKKLDPQELESNARRLLGYVTEDEVSILKRLIELKDCGRFYTCKNEAGREVIVKGRVAGGGYIVYVQAQINQVRGKRTTQE